MQFVEPGIKSMISKTGGVTNEKMYNDNMNDSSFTDAKI